MRKHFYYFNFFRLLAAIIVLTCHARCELFATYSMLDAGSQNIFTKLLFAFFSLTPEAMSVFFVLSGFLVGGPTIERLIIAKDSNRDNIGVIAYNYMINRVIRIIPPLFVAIILAAMVKYIGGIGFSCSDAFLNLLGLQGVCASDFGGVYWSLAYEIWFYVLIGSIICLASNGRTFLFMLGCVTIALTGMVFIVLPIRWLFVILLGVVLYFMRGFRFSKVGAIVLLVILAVAHVISILCADSQAMTLPLHGIVNPELVGWVINIVIGLLVVSLCESAPTGKFTNWIENMGNKWAPFTYCLYITHFTVLELYKHVFGKFTTIDGTAIGVFVAMCVICLLFGWAFFRLIEEPIARVLTQKLYKS